MSLLNPLDVGVHFGLADGPYSTLSMPPQLEKDRYCSEGRTGRLRGLRQGTPVADYRCA